MNNELKTIIAVISIMIAVFIIVSLLADGGNYFTNVGVAQ